MALNREHFRAMVFYDFKGGLTEQQCADRLTSTFGDEAPTAATVSRWYSEFNRSSDGDDSPKSVELPQKNVDVKK